jgi:hypothetical protein
MSEFAAEHFVNLESDFKKDPVVFRVIDVAPSATSLT